MTQIAYGNIQSSLPARNVSPSGSVTVNTARVSMYAQLDGAGEAHLKLIYQGEGGDWVYVPGGAMTISSLDIQSTPDKARRIVLPNLEAGTVYHVVSPTSSAVLANVRLYVSGLTEASVSNTTTNDAVQELTNKTLTAGVIKNGLTASGSAANDYSASTGTFLTSSGANTLSGTTTIAANKNLLCAAGTTAVDLSLGTGTFKPPTGTFTFQGKQAATATANVIADPGTGVAIPVTTSGVCMITTAAAETNTLAIPTFVGQELALIMDTRVGGDRVVTAAAGINQTGNTIMTFGAAGDMIVLRGMKVAGSLVWRTVANDGVALS